MKTPAKKAFILTVILYALLLSTGYVLYTSNTTATKETVIKLTTVPVTLSMFQPSATPPAVKPKALPDPLPEPPKPMPKKVPPKQEPKAVEPSKPVESPKPVTPKQIEPKKIKSDSVRPKNPTPKPVVSQKTESKPRTETPEHSVETTTEKIPPPRPSLPPVSASDIVMAEQTYLSELNAMIAQYAQNTYPKRAKRRRWEGEVLIQFTLLPNGKINALTIIQSSGRTLLDNAALSIFQVKMNNRFKPFPNEIKRTQWHIKVPVNYNLTF